MRSWRRSLNRWIHEGIKPSLANRQDVAEALGLPRDSFNITDDEDEEAAPMGDLASALQAYVHQLVRVEADKVA